MKKLFVGMILAILCMMFGTNTAFAAEITTESYLPYIIKNGATYYESSYHFGSGRRGIVNEENPYTTIPCYAGINGYSFLDKNGYVLDSSYVESEDDIFIPEAPEGTVKIFKHFKSTLYRNGWVDSDDVILNEDKYSEPLNEKGLELPAEQKPEEIIKHINDEIQKRNQKTVIVIDFSGSMDDNQREVINLIETLEFNDNTTIIAFADWYKVITQEQLVSRNFYLGGGTKMISALNKAISYEPEHLIIISDLETHDQFDGIPLGESKALRSVVIYDPDDSMNDSIVDDMLKVVWSSATISRVRIK